MAAAAAAAAVAAAGVGQWQVWQSLGDCEFRTNFRVYSDSMTVRGPACSLLVPVSPSTLWAVLGLEAVYWYVQHCCLAAAVGSEHLHSKLWVGVLNTYLDAVFAPALAVAQASMDLCVK
jgi:hypothetical protein